MSPKIHKYKLDGNVEIQRLALHGQPQMLQAGFQKDAICVWLIEDTEAEKQPYEFLVLPTGVDFPAEPVRPWIRLNTVFLGNGALVFHIFYRQAACHRERDGNKGNSKQS